MAPAEPYFRQLLAGHHVARAHPAAGQMANFMYLIGDVETREALVVDPAWNVGDLSIRFLHTPGHTPGSQCFLVGNRLVAGDTLFVQGCGRVDLPGGDPEAMYHTLTTKLAKLPEDTILFPGHNYGPTMTSTIGEQLQDNVNMKVRSLDDWRRMMGA